QVGEEFRRSNWGRRRRAGSLTGGCSQGLPMLGEGTGGRFGSAEDGGKFKALLQAGEGGEVRVTGVDAGADHGEAHTARRGARYLSRGWHGCMILSSNSARGRIFHGRIFTALDPAFPVSG